jgi:hypothetical protein
MAPLSLSACAAGGSESATAGNAALTTTSDAIPASWFSGSFKGSCADADSRVVVLERSTEGLRLRTQIDTGHATGDATLDYTVQADGSFQSSTSADSTTVLRTGQCDESACFFDSVAMKPSRTEHFADTYRRTQTGIQFTSTFVGTVDGKTTTSAVACDLVRQ